MVGKRGLKLAGRRGLFARGYVIRKIPKQTEFETH
jgi:hypothetical protein